MQQVRSDAVHEPQSPSGTPPSVRGAQRDFFALLMLVTASLVGARILMGPGAFSVNDGSRWATVRALVDTGSYAIGYREQHADGTYRDLGIITDPGWETVDIVLDPATHRFYSTKPTLLPTLVAGEYWVLRHALHLDISRDRLAVARTILITVNLLPFVFYMLVFARLIERMGTTMWGGAFVFTTACFGTFVPWFLATLNNHTVAATGALFAVYQCLCMQLDDDRRWWRFALAGVFAGWTVCNELPAAALACGLMLWLVRLSPRNALRLALPAMLVPVAAYLLTQYLAVGSILPTYAQKAWYEFAGSYFANPTGIDLADEPKLVYAANLLVGHTGILSLTPALLLGWIGMIRTAMRGHGTGAERSPFRMLAGLTLALTIITFGFYVIGTNTYGGIAAGPRWFFWLVPLWLLMMVPEADRWALDPRLRRIAFALLTVSIVTASYALLVSPWRSPWLVRAFRALGLISY